MALEDYEDEINSFPNYDELQYDFEELYFDFEKLRSKNTFLKKKKKDFFPLENKHTKNSKH